MEVFAQSPNRQAWGICHCKDSFLDCVVLGKSGQTATAAKSWSETVCEGSGFETSWASLRINPNKRRLFAFLCTNAQENPWLLWYFKCFENMWDKNRNKDPAEFHRCSCSCDPLGNSPAIAVLQFEVTWVKTTWSVWQLERDFRPEYNQ